MKLIKNSLSRFKCKHLTTTEDAEIATRDGKEYWVCPRCIFEHLIAEKDVSAFKGKESSAPSMCQKIRF